MKKLAVLIAAIATSASPILAAEVEVKAKADADAPKVQAEVKADADRPKVEYKQEARIRSAIRPQNKADSLVGMEIRNRNDERLGEVKDVVLDLASGKISYVAVATGGSILGVGEKLIAVPPGALTPSQNSDKILIMDATKGEVVDAPGFASTNWPDHRNPNFDEAPYWRPKNRGSAPTAESGKAKLYTDADSRDKKVKAEVNVDHDRERESVARTRTDDNRTRVMSGKIRSINNDRVVIETNAGRDEILSVHNNSISSSQFKAGDRVSVKYHTDNGRMIVDDLTRQ